MNSALSSIIAIFGEQIEAAAQSRDEIEAPGELLHLSLSKVTGLDWIVASVFVASP
jgi:hypothetical protein